VFNVAFQHKYMAISGTKGQGWRAIPTQRYINLNSGRQSQYNRMIALPVSQNVR